MAKIPFKIELETEDLLGVYNESTSTIVCSYSPRTFVVFVYEAKECWAVTLATTISTCN